MMQKSNSPPRLINNVDQVKVAQQRESLAPFLPTDAAKASECPKVDPARLALSLFSGHSYLWVDKKERDAVGCPGLVAALAALQPSQLTRFVQSVLPIMFNSLQSLILIDDGRLRHVVERGVVDTRHFTQFECFQILSAAFLCQFPRRSANCVAADDDDLPSINFDEMHLASGSVEREKLLMFLDYFDAAARRVEARDETFFSNKLTILRRSFSDKDAAALFATRADAPLIPAVMHALRESIDDQHDMLRIDFANRLIGGASLAYGCVQEEITFSVCPELNVARLYHAPMADNEAIILLNSQQYSRIKEGSYGFSLQHGGPCSGSAYAPNGIIALDAMDFRQTRSSLQYTAEGVDRELFKFLAGCSSFDGSEFGLSDHVARRVATGNWGCGVFRGDAELKLLIQWIACSLAGREMHYFPFDRRDLFEGFPALQEKLIASHISALGLLQVLRTKLANFSPRSETVWNVVARNLLR